MSEVDMDIWALCHGADHIKPVRGQMSRVVESQEQVATLQLVDNLAEQALLEELIENTKPPLPPETEHLHYLLRTPFRYPPLRWGSRFGSRQEPSLFYGAGRLDTALAETAYYRFVLWSGMQQPPPSGRILSKHSSFEVRYQSERGVRLQMPPFATHRALLTDPRDYRATQRLGTAMRAADVQAFQYSSARCPEGRYNVALFGPQALAAQQPTNMFGWLCETTAEYVAFKQAQGPDVPREFRWQNFAQDGVLPLPA